MNNTPEVVMLGLGYIGLPTAALIAEGMDDELPDFSSPSALDKYSRAYWHLVSSPAKLLLNIGSIAQNRHGVGAGEYLSRPEDEVRVTPDGRRQAVTVRRLDEAHGRGVVAGAGAAGGL